MKSHEIEDKIRKAVKNATPNLLDDIKAKDAANATNYATKQQHTGKRFLRSAIAVAAAAAVLVIGFTLGSNFNPNQTQPIENMVAAVVAFDVNPSVELQISADEKVIFADAKNADGAAVLYGMQLEGVQLNVAVNAIVGSMLQNGYIDELANSILISVEGHGLDAKKLEEKLVADVEKMLNSNAAINAAILSQTVQPTDKELKSLADTYEISSGKAALISQLIEGNTRYTFDELAKLSINELNLLAQTVAVENISSIGNASDKKYIGESAAKAIAFKHAGVAESDARKLEVALDLEDGFMVYEVEFDAGEYEYDYDINAETGEIVVVNKEKEFDDDDWANEPVKTATPTQTPVAPTQPPVESTPIPTAPAESKKPSNNGMISYDKAIEIALSHKGFSRSNVRSLDCELDRDDGEIIYEVEFEVKDYEYEYEINAITGAIISWDIDYDD